MNAKEVYARVPEPKRAMDAMEKTELLAKLASIATLIRSKGLFLHLDMQVDRGRQVLQEHVDSLAALARELKVIAAVLVEEELSFLIERVDAVFERDHQGDLHAAIKHLKSLHQLLERKPIDGNAPIKGCELVVHGGEELPLKPILLSHESAEMLAQRKKLRGDIDVLLHDAKDSAV